MRSPLAPPPGARRLVEHEPTQHQGTTKCMSTCTQMEQDARSEWPMKTVGGAESTLTRCVTADPLRYPARQRRWPGWYPRQGETNPPNEVSR